MSELRSKVVHSDPDEHRLKQAALAEARGDFDLAIALYSSQNRFCADAWIERELLRLRREAFLSLERVADALPGSGRSGAPELDPRVGLPVVDGPPTGAVVRSAIEAHGSLVVRGLLGAEQVASLRDAVLSALRGRDGTAAESPASAGDWYHEFQPIKQPEARLFTATDGLLAADSPRALFRLFEIFRERGIDRLAADFLGARPAISVEKSVLRCVRPQPQVAWHQDGAFLGERIRTLDVWIALSACGKSAPGLEVLPRRADRVLPTGGVFSWGLPNEVVEETYPGIAGVQPEFEPGDAMLFDQLCVHRTGYLPGMQSGRLGVECWLFAAGAVPADYTGLVL